MSSFAELTDREFQDIYGSRPPTKLEFYFTADDLYHRVAGGWIRYASELAFGDEPALHGLKSGVES